MGDAQPPGRAQVGAGALSAAAAGPRVVRVLPDVPAIDRAFDYAVPPELEADVRLGTMVRVSLNGRRVGGWVVGEGTTAPEGVRLLPIAKVTGWGPDPELIKLSKWAAWRWAGRPSALLGTASPPGAVRALPPPAAPAAAAPAAIGAVAALAREGLELPRALLRLPPAADPLPVVLAALERGPALVVTPSLADASQLGLLLRRAGQPVAVVPREWARAAAGGATVVGARGAAWAPAPRPAAIIVLDAHDEGLQQEQAPTWNAWQVAAERAGLAGVPCLLVSACPSLELLGAAPLLTLSRADERLGWTPVEVVDRRQADPSTGLLSSQLASLLSNCDRVVCVVNRKGRARLLACAACGSLAACDRCGASVVQDEAELECRRCATRRPLICAACGGQRLKNLRAGVTRLREELEALARRPVGEVTGETDELPDTPIVIGTEAVLHRVRAAEAVAFLDFDQELLASRYRAGEQALALLARAARITGGRDGGGRVLVQTRVPDHDAVQAAVLGDPARLAASEQVRRGEVGFPPFSALALVSGAVAAEFVAGMPTVEGVEVLGPDEGRWLVRAPDHRTLCDALARTPRPAGRVRVEVDPARV